MKHVNLDSEDQRIKEFARSFPIDPEGTIVELEGRPIFRVLPAKPGKVDSVKLESAIRKRRASSRKLNREWEAADLSAWEQLPKGPE